MYRRDAQAGGTKWSTTSRVIGQEGAEAIWVVNGGIPVLCSVHSLRPASQEEVSSHCLTSGIPVLPESLTEGPKGKRGFVDARGGRAACHLEQQLQFKLRQFELHEMRTKRIVTTQRTA